jgi:tellurite resistance protein TehA-like permease
MAAAGAAAIALFLWGFATWWLLLAITSVGTCLRQGVPFNLGWWGAIFPMGKRLMTHRLGQLQQR